MDGVYLMNKKLSAYKTYVVYSGVSSLLFWLIFTVSLIYQIEVIHLNPLELILVGTTLETAAFLFEIPTGIVADIYSRKLSVIIGLLLIGLGFTLEGSIQSFSAVLFAQILWGVGYTFISGALDAWIAEEEKNISLDDIFMKSSQVSQIGSIIGIVLSTVIGNFSVRLPIIIGGSLFIVLSLFMALYMPEFNFKSSAPEDLNTFRKMGHTLKTSLSFIRTKPIIMLLLTITLFYGLSSEGYDRLSTAHFLKDTTMPSIGGLHSVTWFGIFNIIGMFMSILLMQFIVKKLETNKTKGSTILLFTSVFHLLFVGFFALSGNFILMVTSYLLTKMFRTVTDPIYNSWLNKHIDDNARATVLSTNGQLNSLGQIIGGPIIGIVATKYSISIGIFCTTLFLIPVVALYIISILKDKQIDDGVSTQTINK